MIRHSFRRKLRIPKIACNNPFHFVAPGLRARRKAALSFLLIFVFLLLTSCAKPKVPLPPYPDFVSATQKSVPDAVVEIYGKYAVDFSGKRYRSKFNLLLKPGQDAYLELLDPSDHLLYAVSITRDRVGMLWAGDRQYIDETATPQNLNAIAGLSLDPDDLLMLIAGYGLNFSEWQTKGQRKNGWDLVRPPFFGELLLQERLSRIIIRGSGPEVRVSYDDYQLIDNRSIPRDITFDIPARKIVIQWNIDKFLVRDEPATKDLFDLQLPPDVKRISLQDVYHGKPLLLQY